MKKLRSLGGFHDFLAASFRHKLDDLDFRTLSVFDIILDALDYLSGYIHALQFTIFVDKDFLQIRFEYTLRFLRTFFPASACHTAMVRVRTPEHFSDTGYIAFFHTSSVCS